MYQDDQVPNFEKLGYSAENGEEIQNPYYNEGFENLTNENEEQNQESATENTAEQNQEVQNSEPEHKKEYARTENAIVDELNEERARGSVDIDNALEEIRGTNIGGTIERTEIETKDDISEAERNATDAADGDNKKDPEQTRDLSNAAVTEVFTAVEKLDDNIDKIKQGDKESETIVNEVKEHADHAESLAEKVYTSANNNIENNLDEQIEKSIADQVIAKAQQAVEDAKRAQAEYEAQTDEEKALTQEAKEESEKSGEDFEAVKERLEEEKKEEEEQNNDRIGIFGQ